MSRRAAGLEHSALVDRDIHDHGPGLHELEHLAGDQNRCLCAVAKHRADHEISVSQDQSEVVRSDISVMTLGGMTSLT